MKHSQLRGLIPPVTLIAVSLGAPHVLYGEDADVSTTQLQEIVVTATKRHEDILNVPVSITALRGQDLENTQPQTLFDLNGLVPGLNVTTGGAPGQESLAIRGVGGALSATPAVTIYVGDVPTGSSTSRANGQGISMADLMPYDLDHIEVLSGPQGTLYGASTEGGLVKYVLKDPNLNEFSGRAGGNIDYIDDSNEPGGGARAAVNLPLVAGVLGVRLSGFDQQTAGYLNSLGLSTKHINSTAESGGRVAGMWKPSNDLTVGFSVQDQHVDSDSGPNGTNFGLGVAYNPETLTPLVNNLTIGTYVPTPFTQNSQLYSLDVSWNLGRATLASITGYQKARSDVTSDITYGPSEFGPLVTAVDPAITGAVTPFFNTLTVGKLTQELRLQSLSAQRLEWMFGAFYTKENSTNEQPVYALQDGTLIPGLNPFFNNVVNGEGFPSAYYEGAAYTNDTFHFSDQLSLTGGVRYSINRQWTYGTQYGCVFGHNPCTDAENPAITHYVTSRQGQASWLASPEWHFNSDSMVYARYATGYRPGGPTNAPSFSGAPTSYTGDKVTDYEIGFKGDLLQKRLTVTTAVYDLEWTNIEIGVVQDHFGFIGNGKTARGVGGELGLDWVPVNDLRLGATLGYVHTYLTAPAPGANGTTGADLPGISRVNGAVTLDYERPLAVESWSIQSGGALRFATPQWDTVSSAPNGIQIRQAQLIDLYAGVVHDQIQLRAYVRNLLNQQPDIKALNDPTSFASFDSLTEVTPIQPRTVGISVDVNF